jgi:hypothetical protein
MNITVNIENEYTGNFKFFLYITGTDTGTQRNQIIE